jgi:hypothetical protein
VRSNPFHDDVAIDYPSLSGCVDRVRRTLLAEGERDRREPHKVRLHISGRQAYCGTVLSTRVPVRAMCIACGGRGETWSDPCGACEGAGIAHEQALLRVSVPPRSADGVRLYFRLHPPQASAVRVEVTLSVSDARFQFRG